SLASDHFNDWSAGLRLTVPIGYRAANANVRAARLGVARAYAVLQEQELRTSRVLMDQYRLLVLFYREISAQRAQREAYAAQLRARFEEFLAGRGTLDILLEAQRFWANALTNEYAAIAEYNQTLAAFEWAKGTLLRHDNVHIAEGPLPACAQVRAVAHQE